MTLVSKQHKEKRRKRTMGALVRVLKWKPKVGDKVWEIHIEFSTMKMVAYEGRCEKPYNAFRTKQDCQKAIAKIRRILKGDL